MGFAPAEVDQMSFWQFEAAYEGWRKANCPDDGKGLTQAEFDDLAAWIPDNGAAN